MNTFSPATPKVPPILLAYPSVYTRLTSGLAEDKGLERLMKQCYELVKNRPAHPEDRRAGYGFSVSNDALFVVWSQKPEQPDIFILSGPKEGFGPGHTCPTEQELQRGIYGDLLEVPLL